MAFDDGEERIVNVLQSFRKLSAAASADRSVIDEGETSALIVDHTEAGGDGAGVDA